jgi:hypothetical protein
MKSVVDVHNIQASKSLSSSNPDNMVKGYSPWLVGCVLCIIASSSSSSTLALSSRRESKEDKTNIVDTGGKPSRRARKLQWKPWKKEQNYWWKEKITTDHPTLMPTEWHALTLETDHPTHHPTPEPTEWHTLETFLPTHHPTHKPIHKKWSARKTAEPTHGKWKATTPEPTEWHALETFLPTHHPTHEPTGWKEVVTHEPTSKAPTGWDGDSWKSDGHTIDTPEP